MARMPASSPGGKTNRSVRADQYWRAVRWAAALPLTMVGAGIILRSPSAPAKARAFCPPSQGTLQPPDPPGTIDGAKNPELIPDELAYKMLFLSLVEPENPTDEQQARQEAKLRLMDVSANDKAAVLEALGEFRDQMNGLDAQIAQVLKVTPSPARDSTEWLKLADLTKQQDYLFTLTAARLGARLSTEGGVKLQVHLGNVKRGIKSFPTVMAGN